MTDSGNNRVLIVDDSPSIHEDFQKVLPTQQGDHDELNRLLEEVLGSESPRVGLYNGDRAPIHYHLDHAYQGEDAVAMVRAARERGEPYAVAFVDVRMPPGIDGIETIRWLWKCDSHVECVVCTAYSDYSWEQILETIGTSDQLQFVTKPYDVVSVKQMALALTKKWNLNRAFREHTRDLEVAVERRTRQLHEKIDELEKALEEISQLQGILPMCAYCHKIRDDNNYWRRVDDYLSSRTPAEISHGICPECCERLLVGESSEPEVAG